MNKDRQVIYSDDILIVAKMMAQIYLANFCREQGNISYEEMLKLLERAFYPKAIVILIKKLHARGNSVVEGKNPNTRLSFERRKQRFFGTLKSIIKQASDRLDHAITRN